MLKHGGKLRQAALAEQIPLERWLDLSTGISPFPYPVPPVPSQMWHRLPEDEDGLLEIAAQYYGISSKFLLPLAGSQAAIQTLPALWNRPICAGFLRPSYNEHVHAWRVHGHKVIEFDQPGDLLHALAGLDVVVLANPNNPSGHLWSVEELQLLLETLGKINGWLILDEAFIDATPEHSMISLVPDFSACIILRSIGKFFGLAGARAGFAIADTNVLNRLREKIGPWTLSGPARFAVSAALADRQWQIRQRQLLAAASSEMRSVLSACGLEPTGQSRYFQYVIHPHAEAIYRKLRRQAILVRLFDEFSGLRFGLASSSADLQRLAKVLLEEQIAVAPNDAVSNKGGVAQKEVVAQKEAVTPNDAVSLQ